MDRARIRLRTIEREVTRVGTLDEVHMDNGGIRFHVQISEEGRKPFITRWFNDPTPASDLMEMVVGPGYRVKEDSL